MIISISIKFSEMVANFDWNVSSTFVFSEILSQILDFDTELEASSLIDIETKSCWTRRFIHIATFFFQ